MSAQDDDFDYSEEDEEMSVKVQKAARCWEDPDEAEMPVQDMDEDTYGMFVCSITRDASHIGKSGITCSRITRLITSFFLVSVTIALQIALLHYVKEYVSARSVHTIRIEYDKFEEAMYGCTKASHVNCTMTEFGNFRGIPGTRVPLAEAMVRLDKQFEFDDKDAICHIPLSQPHFFSLILLIWTLTCVTEIKKALYLAYNVVNLEAGTMGDAFDETDDGQVLTRLPCLMKIFLAIMVLVPRITVTLILLWTGCRWLLATTNFGDLILNAVALEFVLLIKEAIYVAVIPTRSHLDLSVTKIVHSPRKMTAAWYNFVSSVSLLFLSMAWVFFYMRYWQKVLPEYQWDVHDVCVAFLKEMYHV